MKRHDPLTPEERDLAERLSRLGPHDGPPPALDAKILAAAHDAVATGPRRRGRRTGRRWLGLSGGAGGLITGVGLAASLTLVLGVVWQLRPGNETLPRLHEGPVNDVEQVILIDDELPSAEPRTRVVPPPPAEDAAVAAAAPAVDRKPTATPPEQATRRESGYAASERSESEPSARSGAAPIEDATVEDASPQAMPEAFPEPPRAIAVEPVAAPAPARSATYTTAARAQAERAAALRAESRARKAAAQAMEVHEAAPEPAPAFAPPPAPIAERDEAPAASAAAEGTTLDRIDVTGGRVAPQVAGIPLHEDYGLSAMDWLQRIRDRIEADDLDNALESLQRFRKVHPRVRLPDDLREFLEGMPSQATDADPSSQ